MTTPLPTLRIATRASALAQWQAFHVAGLLAALGGCTAEIVLTETAGDRNQAVPISAIGGKGVFVKEVQAALFDGRADLAVHSAKDLPSETPEGLVIAAVPQRGDARDALVGCRLDDLPQGAVIGTGSNRRRVQLAAMRPDLRFEQLRGNIATRLGKAPNFDAIVMAATALDRLDIEPDALDVLDPGVMIPQVGQGALAVECRTDDAIACELLAAIEHAEARRSVEAERAFLRELGGDCSLPAGAHAVHVGDGSLLVTGVLADDAATHVLTDQIAGVDGEELGATLASTLRTRLEAALGA